MVKDPDLTTEQFEYWKKDFNAFTVQFAKEPLEGNMYVDMIDIESVAKYLITFNLVHNMEINHPKSIFIHKEGKGKYVMGPIWTLTGRMITKVKRHISGVMKLRSFLMI